jgi:hypothetical protein
MNSPTNLRIHERKKDDWTTSVIFVELPIPEAKSSLLPWASTSSLGQLLSETAFLP